MARAVMISVTLVASLLGACSDEARGLDGTDGAVAVDAGLGRPDTGDAPPDAGLDDGGVRPSRSIVQVDLLTPDQIANRLLLPDFETRVVNGGWLALPLQPFPGGQPAWERRIEVDVPGARPEVAVLPGTDDFAGGAGLYGFGVAAGADLEGEVWLGLPPQVSPERWAELVTGLIAYVEGLGPAIVFFEPDEGAPVVVGGRTWRRFSGRADARLEGRVTFGVQNLGAEPVAINAPMLRTARQERRAGATEALRPAPSAWVRALRAAQLGLERGERLERPSVDRLVRP